jgi:hypothetical protein
VPEGAGVFAKMGTLLPTSHENQGKMEIRLLLSASGLL